MMMPFTWNYYFQGFSYMYPIEGGNWVDVSHNDLF